MNDLRKHFLWDSSAKLSELISLLSRGGELSVSDQNYALRTLHTIKGTAQTFGLENAGRMAHRIESRFQSTISNEELIRDLTSLKRGFESSEFSSFDFQRRSEIADEVADLPVLPEKYLSQLSASERLLVGQKGPDEVFFEVYRAEFEIPRFAEQLSEGRKFLETFGEVIAVFPASSSASSGSIAFEFLIKQRVIDATNGNHGLTTRGETSHPEFSLIYSSVPASVSQVVEKLRSHGEKLAEKDGKKIAFQISQNCGPIKDELLSVVFLTLMHLIRNSVDHGFETSGTISIDISQSGANLSISYSDDGKGIDVNKWRGSANDRETAFTGDEIDLIFEPGFSTAKELTETSGRGFGLNAVKQSVESAGGNVSVKSEPGKGTAFEIVLPSEKQS